MSEKNKWLTIGLSVLLILISVSYKSQVGASQCNWHNEGNCPIPTQVCGNGEHVGNPHCVTPTPTVRPTSTPIPTHNPCGEWSKWEEDCITPTVTVTPSVTPTATPEATPTPGQESIPSNPSTNTIEAPASATCNIAFDAPKLQGFKADGSGSVTFSWWGVPSVDKYSIIFGYTPNSLIYGEDNIPSSSTSITLNGLQVGKHVWAKVGAWRGGCEEESNELDPVIR